MRLPPLLLSLLSSKQDAADVDPAAPSSAIINPKHPVTPCSATPCSSSSAADFPESQTCKVYRQVKRNCLTHGQLFVDKDFPPTNESLFLDEKNWNGTDLEIEWKRPGVGRACQLGIVIISRPLLPYLFRILWITRNCLWKGPARLT